MKYFTNLITTLVLFGLIFLLFSRKAHAYIDLGTGSYILQIVIGALLGGVVGVKLFWKSIKALFKKPSLPRNKNEKSEK